MAIEIRRSHERKFFDHGWLKTYHTFSFGDYYDPAHMQFRSLRVINEDRIDGNSAFPSHPHRDMEIVTIILEGALTHRDSMGFSSTIYPGDVQIMSAGTGIFHSESNEAEGPVHLLQVWILPEKKGLTPQYQQQKFPAEQKHNTWRLVISQDGRDGSLIIHQDAEVYLTNLDLGTTVEKEFQPGRYGWLQVIDGSIKIDDVVLNRGDGAAVSDRPSIHVQANSAAKLLLFDLA
ncbi:MAG: pirin family protein [Parachlamydia sp.]|nr:pirin family protein [Parachlamydia sp.]